MAADVAFEVGRLFRPIQTIADVLTSGLRDAFLRVSAIQGYYPMSVAGATGDALNLAGNNFPLAQVGTVLQEFDGDSYRLLGNGTNYFAASGGFGITGIETWVSPTIQGLTIGGWFNVTSTPTSSNGLISKDGATPDRGYGLVWVLDNTVRFHMSGNGAAIFTATSAVSTINEWHFLAGRFIPGQEVAVFVDGSKIVNNTAIPASIFGVTQNFEVGRFAALNGSVANAKARDVFVCAAALSDPVIAFIQASSLPS